MTAGIGKGRGDWRGCDGGLSGCWFQAKSQGKVALGGAVKGEGRWLISRDQIWKRRRDWEVTASENRRWWLLIFQAGEITGGGVGLAV